MSESQTQRLQPQKGGLEAGDKWEKKKQEDDSQGIKISFLQEE